MILPKKDTVTQNKTNNKSSVNIKEKMNSTVQSTNNKTIGYKIATVAVKQQQKFQCRGQEFYNVFTTAEVTVYSIKVKN